MKNLIFILVLVPFFSFSQILVKDVSRISFMDDKINSHKTTEVFDMTIYIENNNLVMKSAVETTKYKIIDSSINKEKGMTYQVIIDKKPHYVYVFTYEKSTGLLIRNKKQDECTIFYERKTSN